MYQSKTPITVQYYETDKMGVVHHSNYFRYFETARTQFFEELGMSYRQCEELGVMSPVLSITCQYKKPCTYMDKLVVTCRIKQMRKLRAFFEYEVRKEDEVIATGESCHTFVDGTMRPINLEKRFPEIAAMMEKAYRE